MDSLEKTLYDLCLPLVENKKTLKVQAMPAAEDDGIHLYVYADNEDIGRLIGRRGVIANALRSLTSIAARDKSRRTFVKFETYDD